MCRGPRATTGHWADLLDVQKDVAAEVTKSRSCCRSTAQHKPVVSRCKGETERVWIKSSTDAEIASSILGIDDSRVAGKELVLEPKVFAVLVQLLMQPGALLTRDQLLDAVWGHRYVTASTLNRVIALARRAFADDVEGPKFIQTVYGSGYRYVGPIEKSVTIPEASPARDSGPPPSTRLPARLYELIGREHELARMGEVLRDARALTVVGTGGMGKTQCAIAFAHEQLTHYPDGVWFFDLAPMQQPIEWLQALALARLFAPAGERELLAKIAQSLAGRSALLLLDNCDRLSTGVGVLLVEILQTTDRLKVLAIPSSNS